MAAENRYQSDAFFLAAVTFVAYLSLAWQFTGPTYQMDEIGYLANAATLSGRTIDAASSYYLGYSLFLLPGFLLFDDPATIWKSVLVTNSLLSALSVFLLHRISGYLNDSRWLRFLAVALCVLYPAYPTMAGYSYSTPGIVLVYVAVCWALCWSGAAPRTGLLVFALLIGFLNWVHPTGLPVAVAAVMTLGLMVWMDRKLVAAVAASVFVIVFMVIVYQQWITPYLLDAMTPEGFEPRLHYSPASDQLRSVLSPGGPVELITRFLAQLGYILIGTLALAAGGVAYVLGRIVLVGDTSKRDRPELLGFLVFGLLSLLGVTFLTAIIFTKPWSYYNNYWLHGRYLEGVLPPFLLISFLFTPPRLHRFAIAFVVFALLIILYWAIGQESGFTDEIELPAFWPQVMYPAETIIVWFLIGGAACVIAVLLPGALAKIALIYLFYICIANQVPWHHQSFRVNGSPSDLNQFIRDNYASGTCVGFSPSVRQEIGNRQYERFNQLSFYLMNYDYRRMNIPDWVENCDGPYLTYADDPAFDEAGADLVAQGLDTGLRVYARHMTGNAGHESYNRMFVRDEAENRQPSFVARISADDLWGRVGTGLLDDGVVSTTGVAGHVFYGPYGFLGAGKYRFSAYGRASNIEGSWFDLASDGGNRIHTTFPLTLTGTKQNLLATGEIEVPEDIQNFELRLIAGSNAVIAFSHYDLELLTD